MITLYYTQNTGLISDKEGQEIAIGWAGNGIGKNNEAMEDKYDLGPLPRGKYTVGTWFNHSTLGNNVAELKQIEGNSFGRSGFFIHGPAKEIDKYGQESEGCIVIPHNGRLKVEELKPLYIIVI